MDGDYRQLVPRKYHSGAYAMMTSSNGNIFRVTGHLCGEFTGPRRALMFSLICARINGWVNNGEAGDLRRHRAHYDVIVMVWISTRPIGSWGHRLAAGIDGWQGLPFLKFWLEFVVHLSWIILFPITFVFGHAHTCCWDELHPSNISRTSEIFKSPVVNSMGRLNLKVQNSHQWWQVKRLARHVMFP